MQRHLQVVVRHESPRPAKVVQLEVRREARRAAARLQAPDPPRRPAA